MPMLQPKFKYQYFIAAFTPHCMTGAAVIVEPWAETRDVFADDIADGIRYDTEEEAEKAIAEWGEYDRHYIVLKTIYKQ